MATTDTDSSPLHDLTAFQRDLLVVIDDYDGEPAGLDIKRQIEHEYGTTDINHGRLYPNLDDLVERGLVHKGSKDRRTNEYTITTRGTRELQSHRDWMGA